MTLTPVGPGGPITVACSKAATGGAGYGEWTTFKCDYTGIPVNTYEVLAEVDGTSDTTVYCHGIDEDAFVVYDPSLGYTTAGGWFYWPGSEITEGPCAGYPGDRTNLGYTMKYNNKATKVQGSALLQRHTIDPLTCFDAGSYRVKSNALYGLSIGDGTVPDDYGWAAFAGKATYRMPNGENEGNHQFFIYTEDHGEQGCNQNPTDRMWIEVRDKDDLVVMQVNGPD